MPLTGLGPATLRMISDFINLFDQFNLYTTVETPPLALDKVRSVSTSKEYFETKTYFEVVTYALVTRAEVGLSGVGSKCSTSAFARTGLFQGEWVFGFDSAEFADRKSAAWVALQVFDVGSCTCAGLFQRLHRAVAVLAAHHFATLGESFV